MNAPLYTIEILRLATSLRGPVELDRVDGEAKQRSPTCGSTISIAVKLDERGQVIALSQQVQACAFGQASAALMECNTQGRGHAEVSAAVTDLSDWLGGAREDPGNWPGFEVLAPARSRKSRHGAILLPFRALLSAIEDGRK